MTNRIAALSSLACALFCASPSFAAAKQRIALRLDYEQEQGVTDCPDAEQLGLMISAEFGYTVIRSDASALLSVRVLRAPKGLEAPQKVAGTFGRPQKVAGTFWHLRLRS